jgi:hypothetical protein
MKGNPTCEKCRGEGTIKEKDGTIHICYKCLQDGTMDQHDKKVKSQSELGVRLY